MEADDKEELHDTCGTDCKSEEAAEPPKCEKSADPSESEENVDPPKSQGTADPSESEETVDPPKSQGTADPSESEQIAEPPKCEESADPSESEVTADPPKSEKTADSSESEEIAETPTCEESADPSESEVTVDPPKPEVTADPPESEETANQRKSEESANQPDLFGGKGSESENPDVSGLKIEDNVEPKIEPVEEHSKLDESPYEPDEDIKSEEKDPTYVPGIDIKEEKEDAIYVPGKGRKTRGKRELSPPFPDAPLEISQAYRILTELLGVSKFFLEEPDPRLRGMWDYYDVISNPMWMLEIQRKFLDQEYKSVTEFVSDMRLMLLNCYRFFGPDGVYTKRALKIEGMLEEKLKQFPQEIQTQCSLQLTHPTIYEVGSTGGECESLLLNCVRGDKKEREKVRKTKLAEERQKEKEGEEHERVVWENEVLVSETNQKLMESMWEIPVIGHFIALSLDQLNISSISMYELERIFLMPQASKCLAALMTSLLSTPLTRMKLHMKPYMPYNIWTLKLAQKVAGWYKTYIKSNCDARYTFEKTGIEPQFWKIMGDWNPLEEYMFHELTYHQRVTLVKALCDYIFQHHRNVRDTVSERTDEFDQSLGFDRDGAKFVHFAQFLSHDIRIYKQSKEPKTWVEREMDHQEELKADEETNGNVKVGRKRKKSKKKSWQHGNISKQRKSSSSDKSPIKCVISLRRKSSEESDFDNFVVKRTTRSSKKTNSNSGDSLSVLSQVQTNSETGELESSQEILNSCNSSLEKKLETTSNLDTDITEKTDSNSVSKELEMTVEGNSVSNTEALDSTFSTVKESVADQSESMNTIVLDSSVISTVTTESSSVTSLIEDKDKMETTTSDSKCTSVNESFDKETCDISDPLISESSLVKSKSGCDVPNESLEKNESNLVSDEKNENEKNVSVNRVEPIIVVRDKNEFSVKDPSANKVEMVPSDCVESVNVEKVTEVLGLQRRPLHKPIWLEPDPSDFNLVADSVDGLRKLVTKYCEDDDLVLIQRLDTSKSRRGSHPVCEVKLSRQLSNLLTDVEALELKFVTNKKQALERLYKEWHDFQNRTSEYNDPDEEFWLLQEKESAEVPECVTPTLEPQQPASTIVNKEVVQETTESSEVAETETESGGGMKLRHRRLESVPDLDSYSDTTDSDSDKNDNWVVPKKRKRRPPVKKLKIISTTSLDPAAFASTSDQSPAKETPQTTPENDTQSKADSLPSSPEIEILDDIPKTTVKTTSPADRVKKRLFLQKNDASEASRQFEWEKNRQKLVSSAATNLGQGGNIVTTTPSGKITKLPSKANPTGAIVATKAHEKVLKDIIEDFKASELKTVEDKPVVLVPSVDDKGQTVYVLVGPQAQNILDNSKRSNQGLKPQTGTVSGASSSTKPAASTGTIQKKTPTVDSEIVCISDDSDSSDVEFVDVVYNPKLDKSIVKEPRTKCLLSEYVSTNEAGKKTVKSGNTEGNLTVEARGQRSEPKITKRKRANNSEGSSLKATQPECESISSKSGQGIATLPNLPANVQLYQVSSDSSLIPLKTTSNPVAVTTQVVRSPTTMTKVPRMQQRSPLTLQVVSTSPGTPVLLPRTPPGTAVLQPRTPGTPVLQPRTPGTPVLQPRTPGTPVLQPRTPGTPVLQSRTPGTPVLQSRTPGTPVLQPRTPGTPRLPSRSPGQVRMQVRTPGTPRAQRSVGILPRTPGRSPGQVQLRSPSTPVLHRVPMVLPRTPGSPGVVSPGTPRVQQRSPLTLQVLPRTPRTPLQQPRTPVLQPRTPGPVLQMRSPGTGAQVRTQVTQFQTRNPGQFSPTSPVQPRHSRTPSPQASGSGADLQNLNQSAARLVVIPGDDKTGSNYALVFPNGTKVVLTPKQVADIRAANGGQLTTNLGL